MKIESPSQILTPREWRERKRRDQAGGTADAPTTLYLTNAGTTLGPALLLEPWTGDVTRREAAIARALLLGDESHRGGCASGTYREWERATCGTCALLGWRPTAKPDADWPTENPNYAGWARAYVQAREPIPRAWLPAFLDELNDEENHSYANALRRDVATFGWRLTDERPGYKLPTPTGEKMLGWLREYHGPENPRLIRAHLAEVIADANEPYPAGPYTAADVRAARRALELL